MVQVRRAAFGVGDAFVWEWKAECIRCFQRIELTELSSRVVDPGGAVGGGVLFFGEVCGKG